MSATWDTKDEKQFPVAEDEVLIIDTEDSRNQKRATLNNLSKAPVDSVTFQDGSTQEQAATPDGFGFQIDTTILKSKDFDLSAFTFPNGITMKNDGTVLVVAGIRTGSQGTVAQYLLTEPWNTSTDVTPTTMNIAEDDLLTGVFIRQDGFKMYIVGQDNDRVYEFDLAFSWDPVNFGGSAIDSFQLSDLDWQDIDFKPDGTKMYLLNNTNTRIEEYPLSTPWSVSTAGTPVNSSALDSSISTGMNFKRDGTIVYIVDDNNDKILQYELSTPWDISTMGSLVKEFDHTGTAADLQSIYVRPDGFGFYTPSTGTDTLFQWNLGLTVDGKIITINTDVVGFYDNSTQEQAATREGFNWNLDTLIQKNNVDPDTGFFQDRGMSFKPDGTEFYLCVGEPSGGQSEAGTLIQRTMGNDPWDITDFTARVTLDINSIETIPTDLFWRNDGLKLYVVGEAIGEIHEFDVAASDAWDITQIVFNQTLDISSDDARPQGIRFHPSGKNMYIMGDSTNTVLNYPLFTPWDISTAGTPTASPSIVSDEASPTGLDFKADGTKLYIIGRENDLLYQYRLDNGPWDISAITLENTYDLTQSTSADDVSAVYFQANGERVFALMRDDAISPKLQELSLGIKTEGEISSTTAEITDYTDYVSTGEPADPPTTTGRVYVKTVDSNNEALFVKIKQSGSIVEVQLS